MPPRLECGGVCVCVCVRGLGAHPRLCTLGQLLGHYTSVPVASAWFRLD